MKNFANVLDREFCGAIRDHAYVGQTSSFLRGLGFTADNAIACVATCRDEICRPIRQLIQDEWGEAFNLSSLAGMLTLGSTGFSAFHGHAPRNFDRRQHIYYAMPHVAIGPGGDLGLAAREGIPEGSVACGALSGLAAELATAPPEESAAIDMSDIEQSLLRMRLAKMTVRPSSVSLTEMARLAEVAIREDLEAAISVTVDVEQVDYAVFTGIQIHGPERCDYVFPVESYAVVNGVRIDASPGAARQVV